MTAVKTPIQKCVGVFFMRINNIFWYYPFTFNTLSICIGNQLSQLMVITIYLLTFAV
jgi:hypothetical protein